MKSEEYEETRCFRELRQLRYWQNLATQSPSLLLTSRILRRFSNVRQRYGLEPGDNMESVDVNAIIWRMFTSVTLQSAFYLGKDYSEHLRSSRN